MNVLHAHLCIDKSGMSCIGQDIRVRRSEMLVEILCVQDAGELTSSILAVGSEVCVQLV